MPGPVPDGNRPRVQNRLRISRQRQQSAAPGPVPHRGLIRTGASMLLRTLQRQPGCPLEKGAGQGGCSEGRGQDGNQGGCVPGGIPGVCRLQHRVTRPSGSNFQADGCRGPGAGVLGGQLRCPAECPRHLRGTGRGREVSRAADVSTGGVRAAWVPHVPSASPVCRRTRSLAWLPLLRGKTRTSGADLGVQHQVEALSGYPPGTAWGAGGLVKAPACALIPDVGWHVGVKCGSCSPGVDSQPLAPQAHLGSPLPGALERVAWTLGDGPWVQCHLAEVCALL